MATRGDRAPKPSEVKRRKAQRIFNRWASGVSYARLSAEFEMDIPALRALIRWHLMALWKCHYKWKMAEMRCHALGMELRLLRLGQDQPDQPLESIKPPPQWLKAFQLAGVSTVNQLRAIDSEVLLSRWRFPFSAIDWAIVKLDKLGLSHHLVRRQAGAKIVRDLKKIER